MTTRFTICFFLLIVGCKNNSNNSSQDNQRANIEVGNDFIDAFYSFNRDSLQTILSDARASQPEILYYQKWAECANYKIIKRAPAIEKNDSIVSFPITVKDDLMAALQINFNVTDPTWRKHHACAIKNNRLHTHHQTTVVKILYSDLT